MDEYTGFEQLEKRVEWLDNERRNDKTNLASLQNRLSALETENITLRKQLKELEISIAKTNNQITSFDKYDNRIDRLNIDLTKQIRDVNERAEMSLSEVNKRIKLELEANKRSIADIYPFTEQLDPIRNELKIHKVEDNRLARLIEEQKVKIQEVGRFDEDYRRSLHLLEENRRQEAKRITDLQGEVMAVRKRVEETRSRFDSFSDSFRQLDTRIAELQTFEKDRKEAQSSFIERVNDSLVEKDKTFKTWEARFSEIEKVNLNLNSQLEDLEASRQAVGKAVSGVDDVVQRFERRINEITEIQRLNDERYRQEWTTFKSDDLKRWTNYVLSQEEQSRDTSSQIANATATLQELQDLSEQTRDDLDRLTRETVKHVQSILMSYQESIQSVVALIDKKA
jgi:chromosome segregation ATPase